MVGWISQLRVPTWKPHIIALGVIRSMSDAAIRTSPVWPAPRILENAGAWQAPAALAAGESSRTRSSARSSRSGWTGFIR